MDSFEDRFAEGLQRLEGLRQPIRVENLRGVQCVDRLSDEMESLVDDLVDLFVDILTLYRVVVGCLRRQRLVLGLRRFGEIVDLLSYFPQPRRRFVVGASEDGRGRDG